MTDMNINQNLFNKVVNSKLRKYFFYEIVLVGTVALFLFFVLSKYLNTPPDNFPINNEVVIDEGLSHTEIANKLSEQDVIRSSLFLYLLLQNNYENEFIKAGTYIFETSKTSKEIAKTIINGDMKTSGIKVTFQEGFSSMNLSDFLPEIEILKTTSELQQLEGYLFPDTYFISKEMELDEILLMMKKNFENKMYQLETDIKNSSFTLKEIITLASLIEREAGDEKSKKIVSGILQNRLDINMALQVDAVFDYLLGKESSELTIEDLNIDSPYNTYRNTGLPPTPISNPGLDSINAVLHPTPTKYFYYLTAQDGTFYYAETFEKHKENKRLYLR